MEEEKKGFIDKIKEFGVEHKKAICLWALGVLGAGATGFVIYCGLTGKAVEIPMRDSEVDLDSVAEAVETVTAE